MSVATCFHCHTVVQMPHAYVAPIAGEAVVCSERCVRQHQALVGGSVQLVGEEISRDTFVDGITTVADVQVALRELTQIRASTAASLWHDNGVLIAVMFRVMIGRTAGTAVTLTDGERAKLRGLSALIGDELYVRSKLVEYVPLANVASLTPRETARILAGMTLLTEEFFDPMPGEYDEARDITPRFARSLRPAVYMFRAAPYIREERVRANEATRASLRVIRYMEGMHAGVWHSGQHQRACGTFFFFDPDARTILRRDDARVLVAANKQHALIQMLERMNATSGGGAWWDITVPVGGRLEGPPRKRFLEWAELFEMHSYTYNYFHGGKRPPPPTTWSEATLQRAQLAIAAGLREAMRPPRGNFAAPGFPSMWRTLAQSPTQRQYLVQLPDGYWIDHTYTDSNGVYLGFLFSGHWDDLDRWICKLAVPLDIDIIVLQAEPGRRRAVTEIYDVRDRATSFGSLVRDMSLAPIAVADPAQPCVWYPSMQ